MGRLITTFKDKTFEPSMKSYYQLFSDDTTTAPQIYDSLLYVRGTNAGSLAVGQENDQGPSTVEEYDTYMPVRFYNVKSESDGTTPASPTHTFFSVYNRAEYAGPINQNMYDVWADYNVAKLSNAGYITNTLGGAYNSAYDNGSGDDQTIPAIYGSLNYAEIQPTGDNRVVTYAQGSRSWVKLNKANATATYVYPTTSEFNQTTGTVGTLAMHKFDLDYTAGAITNAYFIWADESSVPTPSGEAYFIKSNIPWQTLLSGPLTNTGAVTFNSTLAVTGNATFNANVDLQDNDYLYLGTGDDLSLVHNGTNSVIENDLGHLNIINNAVDKSIMFSTNEAGGAEAYLGLLPSFPGVFIYKDLLMATDGLKLRMGASQDLELYHDGTNSYVSQIGTGQLIIQNTTDDADILFKSDDGSGGTETYFFLDGSLKLNRFLTDTLYNDNVEARFGTSTDLKIYHDGTNSAINNLTGDLYIMNASDDKDILFQSDDGSGGLETYLHLDGSDRVIRPGRSFVFPDNISANFGAGYDLNIKHNGTDSFIINETGDFYISNQADDKDIKFTCDNGSGGTATYFYLDGSNSFTNFQLNARWQDNIKAQFGNSGDLQVYHDGTDSYLQNDTGDLYIKQNKSDADIIFQSDDGSGGETTYFTIDGGSTMNVFSKPTFHGDGVKSFYGNSSDLQIYHDGNNSFIDSTGAGDLYIRCGSDDESIIFQNDDGSGGLETYFQLEGASGGASPFTAFPDNSNLAFGSGHDMRLYHNGSGSYVDNYTGVLQFTNYTDDSDIIFRSDDGSGGTTAYITLDGSEVSTVISTIKVLMPNLPTSDPSVAGQLWNSSGDLKISAG